MKDIEEEVTAGDIISGIMGIISVIVFLIIIIYLIFFTVDNWSCRNKWDAQGFSAHLDSDGNCMVQVRDNFYISEDKFDFSCRIDRIDPKEIE